MEPTNRRDFLKHASATAAVVGVAAAAPLSIVEKAAADETKTPPVPAERTRRSTRRRASPRTCRPARSRSTRGDREITVKDKRLAALLYKASR